MKKALFSTPPPNHDWINRLGSGDTVKRAYGDAMRAGGVIRLIREKEAEAVANDRTISSEELLDIFETAKQHAVSTEISPIVELAITAEYINLSAREPFDPAAMKILKATALVEPLNVTRPLPGVSGADKDFDGDIIGQDGQLAPGGTPSTDWRPLLPRDAQGATVKVREPDVLVIDVNGITTTMAERQTRLQAVADKTGNAVVGIHNATGWMKADALQTFEDKLRHSVNRAVHSLSTLMFQLLQDGKTPHVVAHSQGGIVTSRALLELYHRLDEHLAAEIPEPVARFDRVQALLGKVRVETFGAASYSYTDGPQYVHYVNTWDLVPSELGLGWGSDNEANWMVRPGRGAKVLYFSDGAAGEEKELFGWDLKFLLKVMNRYDGTSTHSFDRIYWPQRIDFQEARALENPAPASE